MLVGQYCVLPGCVSVLQAVVPGGVKASKGDQICTGFTLSQKLRVSADELCNKSKFSQKAPGSGNCVYS